MQRFLGIRCDHAKLEFWKSEFRDLLVAYEDRRDENNCLDVEFTSIEQGLAQ